MTSLVRMQQRSDTAANWLATNPILLAGEIAYNNTTGGSRVGDGVTAWSALLESAPLNLSTAGSVPFVSALGVVSENTAKGPFWDNTNFELRVGNAPSAYNADGQGDGRIVARTEGANNKVRLGTWGTGIQNFIAFDLARGTIGAPTAIQSGDILGSIVGVGYGTSFQHGSEIQLKTTENWNGTARGSGIRWLTVVPTTTAQVCSMQLGMTTTGVDLELPLGELIVLNSKHVRGYNAAGLLTKRLIGVNNTDLVSIDADAIGAVFGGAVSMTAGLLKVRNVAFSGLPSAAGGTNAGGLIIETDNPRLVMYVGSTRYYFNPDGTY